MKRLYNSFLSFSTFLLLLLQTRTAFADLCPSGSEFSSLCGFDPKTHPNAISNAIGAIVSTLIILAIVLTLLYLVYGGIKYITSGGDKGKIDAARSHIRAAIIGLVISLTAFFVLNLLTYFFLGAPITQFKLPTLLD